MHVCVMRWLRVVGRLLRDQRSVLMIINVFFLQLSCSCVCVLICGIKFILVVVARGSMQDNGSLSGGGFTCPPPQSESGCVTHAHSAQPGVNSTLPLLSTQQIF